MNDASSTYPQWPPVLVSTGLGGAIAAITPDSVPLQPAMVNDPRLRYRVGGVDCVGILRACHRNLPGYSYLRPHKRTKYRGMNHSGMFSNTEDTYFRRNYNEHVPREINMEMLKETILQERDNADIPKWQGNVLAGVELAASDEHAVFFPTGQILQQACVYRTSSDQASQSISNCVETGAVIRQFELLGSAEMREMYGDNTMRIAARGAANCSILTASFETGHAPRLEFTQKLLFNEMLYHVAASPHTDSDLAFITGDGRVHTWNPRSDVTRIQTKNVSVDERLLRCEYSSNPCVLWTSNRVRVQSLDVREPQKNPSVLFDLVKMNAPHSQIYSIKRRRSSPFQLVVGNSVSVEVLDSRMPGRALISWLQSQTVNEKVPYYGVIDEMTWRSSDSTDGGLIISGTQGRKTLSLFSFAKHQLASTSPDQVQYLSLAQHRESAAQPTHPSQYVATDSPLEVHLQDGGEWTTLLGACALTSSSSTTNATLYQLNSMGDLFAQRMRRSTSQDSFEEGTLDGLPCGTGAHMDPDADTRKQRLPLPVDAILPEHDAHTLTPFKTAPIKAFLQTFPRLPDPTSFSDSDVKIESLYGAIDSLRLVCRPSATLFRVHRYVNEELGIRISANALVQMLRSHPRFQVHAITTRFRHQVARVIDPSGKAQLPGIHQDAESDPRLGICQCKPDSGLVEPCDSVACIIPHCITVSNKPEMRTDACFPPVSSTEESVALIEYRAAIQQAQELYGLKE